MYPKYFRDKIAEELNASCDYLKKALDFSKEHVEWAKKFYSMSDDRYKHAIALYAMFIQLYKDSKETDTYMNSIRDGIIGNFNSYSNKVESYKMTYNLLIGLDEEGNTL